MKTENLWHSTRGKGRKKAKRRDFCPKCWIEFCRRKTDTTSKR